MFEEPAEGFLQKMVAEELLDDDTINKFVGLVGTHGHTIAKRLEDIGEAMNKSMYLETFSTKASPALIALPNFQEIRERAQEQQGRRFPRK